MLIVELQVFQGLDVICSLLRFSIFKDWMSYAHCCASVFSGTGCHMLIVALQYFQGLDVICSLLRFSIFRDWISYAPANYVRFALYTLIINKIKRFIVPSSRHSIRKRISILFGCAFCFKQRRMFPPSHPPPPPPRRLRYVVYSGQEKKEHSIRKH